MSRAHRVYAVIASGLVVFASAAAVAERGDPNRVERRLGEVKEQGIASSHVTISAGQSEVSQTAMESGRASAPSFHLDWWSVNGGGATNVTGTNYGLGMSVGQAAAGFASGTNYSLGLGFWYGAVPGGCPMTIFGDVDLSASVTSADIIYLVNFVFKGGPNPLPCDAAADVDCGGSVTSADIIYLVNFVFKGGPPPCNTCTSPLAGAC